MQRDSFERFYFEKVALSEGCGCAENIIGTRDLEARFQETAMLRLHRKERHAGSSWLGRIFRRGEPKPDPSKLDS